MEWAAPPYPWVIRRPDGCERAIVHLDPEVDSDEQMTLDELWAEALAGGYVTRMLIGASGLCLLIAALLLLIARF